MCERERRVLDGALGDFEVQLIQLSSKQSQIRERGGQQEMERTEEAHGHFSRHEYFDFFFIAHMVNLQGCRKLTWKPRASLVVTGWLKHYDLWQQTGTVGYSF